MGEKGSHTKQYGFISKEYFGRNLLAGSLMSMNRRFFNFFQSFTCLIPAFVLTFTPIMTRADNSETTLETAILGGGCFWCIEALYDRLDGVQSVKSGYAGGRVENPTYQQVSRGNTGHAEVVKVEFDPDKISYRQLIDFFWEAHDPTTKDRQGADVGPQYRSIILYLNETQKKVAEQSMAEAQNRFDSPVQTEIEPLDKFYEAENYHQDYYENNPNAPYCRFVITPKLNKLEID